MDGWVDETGECFSWMDGWMGWGAGDDGLRRRRKRKQVGSHQTVLWQIQSQCWWRSWSWWCNKLPGTWKFHLHFGTAAQPRHVANLDGSRLDGTAGSSPKLAGLGQGLCKGTD